MEAAPHPWPALGVLLLRDGLVDKDELEELLDEQEDTRQRRLSGWKLGEILVQRGRVTEEQVARLVAEQYELPYLELEDDGIDLGMAARLPADLIERFTALAVEMLDDGSALVAVSDPGTVLFSNELRRALGMPVRFAVVAPAAMTAAISYARAHAVQTPSSALPSAWPTAGPAFDVIRDEGEVAGPARSALTFAAPPTAGVWPPLGAILVRDGLVSEDELETALAQQRLSSDKRLGEILVERGAVTRADIARVVAEQYELPFLDVAEPELDSGIANLLPVELAAHFSAIPLKFQPDDSLLVAVADPTKVMDAGELFAELGGRLTFAVADPDVIESALLRRRLEPPSAPAAPESAASETEAADEVDPPAAHTEAALEPETGFTESEPAFDQLLVDGEPSATAGEDLPGDQQRGEDHEDQTRVNETDAAPVESAMPVGELYTDLDTTPDHQADDALVAQPVLELAVPEASEPHVRALSVVPPHEDATDHEPDEVPAPGDEHAEPDHERSSLDPVVHLGVPEAPAGPDERGTDLPPVATAPAGEPAADDLQRLVEQARELGASAIHFSPRADSVVARARVEGRLRELGVLAECDGAAVALALRSESRLDTVVLPARAGDVVTALLEQEPLRAVHELGLAPVDEDVLRAALEHPSGLVLLAGRGASGITTTAYALLGQLEATGRAVFTVEDPIDRTLPGVTQVEAGPQTGLTVAQGLARIARADPDVVFVAATEDERTTELVVRGAERALVVAAVRASTAADAVRRLLELGADVNTLASTLRAVAAQCLVRRICVHCRESYFPTSEELVALGRSEEAGRRLLGRGKGCETCAHSGFEGHVAVFDVVPASDELRAWIRWGASASAEAVGILGPAGEDAFRDEVVRLCLDGVTTVAEVRRVLGPPAGS